MALTRRERGEDDKKSVSEFAHHGWIPEGVQAITSTTGGRSRTFGTPVGLFAFTRVPQRNLLAGVRRVSEGGGPAYFLATPLKALADLVYAQRHRWSSAAPAVESLRIEEESLAMLTEDLFEEVMSAHGSGRVEHFLLGLRKDVKL